MLHKIMRNIIHVNAKFVIEYTIIKVTLENIVQKIMNINAIVVTQNSSKKIT